MGRYPHLAKHMMKGWQDVSVAHLLCPYDDACTEWRQSHYGTWPCISVLRGVPTSALGISSRAVRTTPTVKDYIGDCLHSRLQKTFLRLKLSIQVSSASVRLQEAERWHCTSAVSMQHSKTLLAVTVRRGTGLRL